MIKFFIKDKYRIIIIFLIILFIVIMALTSNQYKTRRIETVIGNVLVPVQNVFLKPFDYISDRYNNIIELRNVKETNNDLMDYIKELEEELIEAKLDKDQYYRLGEIKEKLNYVEDQDYEIISTAEIINRTEDNWHSTIRINAGRNKGIEENDIVVYGNVLVGRIIKLGDNWAQVMPLIDVNSAVSFQTVGESSYHGVLKGSRDESLVGYLFDPDSNVFIGDLIITSTQGNFPRGIVIGEVVDVRMNQNNLLKEIEVEPNVNFRTIKDLTVIRTLK